MLEFCVQETIGGWKQVPCFFGSYEECEAYLDGQTATMPLSRQIVTKWTICDNYPPKRRDAVNRIHRRER